MGSSVRASKKDAWNVQERKRNAGGALPDEKERKACAGMGRPR